MTNDIFSTKIGNLIYIFIFLVKIRIMAIFPIGTFIVDPSGTVEVDFLFDGGWFRGELAIFSLEGMESFEPGSKEFVREAARRALTDSLLGHIILQDELEGAQLSSKLAWERNFNTGEYQGVKTFNMTPGDEVGLMLVQHTTIQNTLENIDRISEFGRVPLFSSLEANLSGSSAKRLEVVDVDDNGTIALEDVPIQQADKDYNDLILNLRGLESNLALLSDNINPNRDWRKTLILVDRKLEKLSDDRLVIHLDFDKTANNIAIDSSPEGENNEGKLSNGAEFSNGIVEFGGNNDIIEVLDSKDINLGTHAKRTISLWFNVDDKNLPNRKQVIYEEGGVNFGDAGLNIYIDAGVLYFGGWNREGGSWSSTYLSTDEIYSNTWHHVALVLDAEAGNNTLQPGAFTAYLDGEKIAEGEGVELDSHKDNIGIGGLNETTRFHNEEVQTNKEYSLAGSLDELRVYNRALSAKEVSLLFALNHKPIATDDESVTIENTEVILFQDSLLANDTDLDGNILSLTSVDNAVNGSVTINNSGNVVFTPKPNFDGDASFEYTISDGQGETNTATVTVTVLPILTPISLGTNLHRLASWSPQLPFLNAFKSARRWIPQSWGTSLNPYGRNKYIWDTGESNLLDLDENGWVKSLPAPEDEPEYSSVGTLMYRNVGDYSEGRYIVLYEGEGTIEYGLDAQKDESASTPGRDVLNVEPTNAGIWLRITETDPNDTGNYLRNIQVMQEEDEHADRQVFNPEFLEKIQPFDTLRFMDWMATNNSQQGEWDNRPTPDNSQFFGEIATLEDMVELANRTDSNPWFTLPHMATDEYITNFAQYVRDNLDPELKVYVEYSNEVWSDFAQGWWVEERGKEEFPDPSVSNFNKRLDWFGQRTTEITQIWDEVFATDKERVIGVLGAQAANIWTARRALEYSWADQPLSHEEYGIDAIAIAPYFGRYLGKPHFSTEIESWTDDENPDLALDNLFREITQGGVLSHAPVNGALQQAYDWTEVYSALAEEQDLELLTYESSQHIVGINGVQENETVSDLFIAANRDPRMGEIYQEYFSTLHELGVDLQLNYSDVSRYNKWGSWGVLGNIGQEDSPKYNALKSLKANNNYDNNLPPQLGVLNSNLSRLGVITEGDTLNLSAYYTDVGITDYHTIKFDWGDNSPVNQDEKTPLLGGTGEARGNHVYDSEGKYTATLTIADDDDLMAEKSLSVTVAKKIDINWRPDFTDQQMNLAGNGEVRVAIFGTKDFTVVDLDPTSIRADDQKNVLLDGKGIAPINSQSILQDINADGFQDLLLSFGKSDLKSVIKTNSDLSIGDRQIYLFGSSSQLEGGYFFGIEPAEEDL